MSPTLKPFDILGVMPYNNRKTQCGDLIVFSHPETGCNVVHRAASINSRGISTKADNSKDVDPWILNPDNIHGLWAMFKGETTRFEFWVAQSGAC